MAKIALAALVAASANAPGFLFATKKDVDALVKAGHAEVNEQMVDPSNAKQFAVRATQAGIDFAAANPATETQTPPRDEAPAFEIESIAREAVSTKKRANAGTSRYPFDKMPDPVEGQPFPAFFVPATDKMPDPAKSLQSAISAANRKFATKTGEKPYEKDGETKMRGIYSYTREFKATAGERTKDGVTTKGAWIARIK